MAETTRTTAEKSSVVGDTAKLREALGKLRAELWNNTVISGKRKFELYEIADAALSSTPRNNAVKTGDMLLAENERLRKALSDICENLRIHLQLPTQTISMNRREVECMINDCEKGLSEEGENNGSK